MADIKLREAGEDYLEAILELEVNGGAVRSIDVANRLGVTKPSVSKAMGILKSAGFIEQQLYGSITLTEEGRKRAHQVKNRHIAIKRFLTEVLGVDGVVADEDACKMEHVVSEETMTRLLDFLGKQLDD